MPTATPHPPYRLFETRVAHTERVSPAFVRVTLVGPTLHLFAPWGLDQRIKLVLPRPDGAGDGWAGPLAGDVDGLAPDDWRFGRRGRGRTGRHGRGSRWPSFEGRRLDGSAGIERGR
nr:siderophore-interacting protein [Clavibacter michiganensis]